MTLEEKLLDYGCEGAAYLTEEYYDDAAIGYTDDGRVVYDYDLLVECLMKEDMSEIDAIEWVEYNILRSIPYCGEQAPIVIHRFIE